MKGKFIVLVVGVVVFPTHKHLEYMWSKLYNVTPA